MTILEQFNLIFYKNQCIKVIIVDTNKRVNTHIIKLDDSNLFSVGQRTYLIDYVAVYLSKGIPTYFYYIDNPSPVTKEELMDHTRPLDIKEASMKIEVSSAELYNAIEETVLAKIIRYAEDGDKKIINTIFAMGGINLLVLIGGLYFLYMQLEKVIIFIAENEDIIKAIKEILITGVGN